MIKVGDLISVNEKLFALKEYHDFMVKHVSPVYLEKLLMVKNKKVIEKAFGINELYNKEEIYYIVEGLEDIIIYESEVINKKQLELF